MKIDIEENKLQTYALDNIRRCRESIRDGILEDSSYFWGKVCCVKEILMWFGLCFRNDIQREFNILYDEYANFLVRMFG